MIAFWRPVRTKWRQPFARSPAQDSSCWLSTSAICSTRSPQLTPLHAFTASKHTLLSRRSSSFQSAGPQKPFSLPGTSSPLFTFQGPPPKLTAQPTEHVSPLFSHAPVLFPAPTHFSVYLLNDYGCKSTLPLFHKDHTYLVYHCASLHMGDIHIC